MGGEWWTVGRGQWTANNGKSVGFVFKCKYYPIIVNGFGVIAQREILMLGERRILLSITIFYCAPIYINSIIKFVDLFRSIYKFIIIVYCAYLFYV